MTAESIASRRRFATLEEWLAWLETLHPKKIDFGLERIGAVLEALGLRQPPFRIVTVAGTNGKGSCAAMLESVYLAAGYRVGMFSSPHLVRFNERIRFAGEELSDRRLVEIFERIDAARGEVSLSYFEWSAVAALAAFALADVELAVLEVGMGGRLDATNAVDADVSLIASVDLDHQQWLGSDRDAIGREKAGIARSARPAIVADRAPPAGLLDELARRGARLVAIGRDFDAEPVAGGWRYRARGVERTLPRPRFGGAEQLRNAAAVAATVEALDAVLPVAPEALTRGLEEAHIRGRQERWRRDGVEWVFDVAHNAAAAAALVRALGSWPAATRTSAVLGMMADKDLERVLAPFMSIVDAWWLAPTASERSASPQTLARVLRSLGGRRIEECESVAGACAAAQVGACEGERVLVFGSFYTVGPALVALGLYSATFPPGNRPATWTQV